MPAADHPAVHQTTASVTHAGEALRFAGILSRGNVIRLWKQLPKQLDGIRRFELDDVTALDSAGVALLAEVAARCGGDVAVKGGPQALSSLSSAYRLDETLGFTTN